MYRIMLLMALVSLSFVQCKTNKDEAAADEILIIGKYLNSPNSDILLESLSPLGYFPIDTVRTDQDGNFRIRANVKSIGIYRIRNNQSSYLTLIMSPGEKATVSADALNVDATFMVQGPEESELMFTSELRKRYAYQRLDSLRDVWQEGKEGADNLELRTRLDSISEVIFIEYKTHLQSFIDANPNRLATIFALYQRFAGRKIFDEQTDFAWYEKVSSNLSKAFPGSPHAEDIKKRVEAMREQQNVTGADSLSSGN